MSLSYRISRRLRLSKGASGRTGVAIAITGVALALIVMELTLAVVVGFKEEIKRKLTGFDAQLTIAPAYSIGSGEELQAITADSTLYWHIRQALPENASIDAALRMPGILKTDNDFEGAMFLARDPDGDFTFEKSNIVAGVWPDYSADSCRNHIVISESMASSLGLAVGDKVYSTFVVNGAVKARRHTIAGLYRSDFGDYDRTVAYTSPDLLRSVASLSPVQAGRIEIRGLAGNLSDYAQALQTTLLAAASTGQLEGYYPVSCIEQTGAIYYNWLALLDTNVIVIFILMIAVASFTLVSSMFILILERVRTIGILRALGAGSSLVRDIFVHMSLRTVLIGLAIGNVAGIGLTLIQRTWHVVPLNPEMYYLSSVPATLEPWGLVALNVGVVAISWLVLVVPARLASRIDPATAVKYE